METLENRITPATFVVNSVLDLAVNLTDSVVTLRDAITAANTNVAVSPGGPVGDMDGDTIVFDSTVFGAGGTIVLTKGDMLISDDVTIDGSTGSGTGSTAVNIDGATTSRIFSVNTTGFPGTVNLVSFNDLVLQNGNGKGTNSVNDGRGGAIFLDDGSNVAVTGTAFLSNTVTAASAKDGGGGIYSQNSILTVTNSDFDNNVLSGTGASGGGIFQNGGNLTVSGSGFGTVSTNLATRAGGGIEIRAVEAPTTTAIDSSDFLNNSAGINGGGLHVSTAQTVGGIVATVTVTGGTFAGNTAGNEGGGLWNDFQGMMTIDGTTISNNIANGMVSSSGGGGVFSQGGGILSIANATIINNKAAGNGGTPATSGSGGGVLVDGGTVTITNSTLSQNSSIRAGGGLELNGVTNPVTATISNTLFDTNDTGPVPGNGGGIHITTGSTVGGPVQVTATVTGGSFTNNTASNEGGGLWNDIQGSLTVSGTTISGNIAAGALEDSGGGGLFSQGGTLTVSNAKITGNKATGTGGTGPTSGSGGGILIDGGTLNLSGSTLSGNTAVRAGGGIEIRSTAREATATITSTFVNNNNAGPTPGNGGGLHVTAPSGANPATVSVTGGTYIGNTASAEGGGLWNDVAGTLTISNVTIAGNKASGAGADQGGGGVFNNGGTTTITNSTIAGNIADGAAGSGGGILNDGGTLTVTGGTVAGNSAIRAGGGIEATAQNRDSTVELTDVSITGNTTGNSPGNGGGIHITDTLAVTTVSMTTITGGTISGNLANQEGGGVWNDTGTMTISGTTITGNTANVANAAADAQGGGGLFNNGGKVTVSKATITNNVVGGTPGTDDGGGGVFNDGRTTPGSITISDTIISGNTAITGSGNGGGILNIGTANGASVTVTGGSITNNKAARAGGGIETNAADVTLTSLTVSGNNAGINGGGLHVSGAGTVSVSSSTFSTNNAVNEGGGLWNSSDPAATISIDSSTISTNTAKFGGGLFNDGTAGTISLINSTVSGNTATLDGGGIDTEGGTLNIALTTITNNTATNSGGINADAGNTLAVTNSIVAGNTATTDTDTNATIAGGFNFVGGDPLLGPLQNNGGPTLTHRPLVGSPVLDAGDPAFTSPPDFDQRGTGFPRVLGAKVDIGAVEVDLIPPAAPVVTAPAAATTVDADTFNITGTAEANSLVQIFRDVNNDGMIDMGDTMVGMQQLAGGATAFAVSVTLQQLAANNFLVSATDAAGNKSAATVVPTITEADLTAPAAPTVTAPAAPVTVDANTFAIQGMAEVGTLVQVYRDLNNNGAFDTGEPVVGSQQLMAGASYSIAVPLNQNAVNNFLVTATDAAGNKSAATVVPAITESSPAVTAATFAVGQGSGGTAQVQLYASDGTKVGSPITAFPGFTGDVRVATADFNNDGVLDIVVGTGPGRATSVRVLNGKDGSELFQVQPFESAFTGGVFVAVGDVDNDGVPDLVITPDEGGGPRVDIYKGAGFTKVVSFFGIDDTTFRGGARAALGDMNNDGVDDLVVVAGFGGGPRVAGFDGKTLTGTPMKLFNDFFAFEQTLRNGIFVAVGDLNGDGFADLIAGGGPGGGPRVLAFDGANLLSNKSVTLANFFAGNPNSRGGVRLAAKNLDNDSRDDLITGAGNGAGSNVSAYLGSVIMPTGTPATALNFEAFTGFTGGVFVG